MKRILVLLLCIMMAAALIPTNAYAEVSDRGVELVLPEESEYFAEPFEARAETGRTDGSLPVMPKPAAGCGHLAAVPSGSTVTVLAQRGSYLFFETENGDKGWNRKGFFAYCTDENGDTVIPDYPMVSSMGYRLRFPNEKSYLAEPFTKVVSSCGRIYLMPMPEEKHGDLGTVEDGDEVTVLADISGYYFFKTADGRYGWNGKVFFK